MITANVQDQTLSLQYDEVISDSNRYLEIEFNFSSAWQSKTKVAIFKNGETELQVAFIDSSTMYLGNDRCYVPSEVIKSPKFSVSVYGVSENVVITTNEADVAVEESGIHYLDPAEPTPSIWNQLLNAVNPMAKCPSGGTSGQILQKNSDDDYDYSWKSIDIDIMAEAASYFVPNSRKVNNKPLSADITIDCNDIGAYSLPQSGIPKSDLSADIKASLLKADTALQEHQSLSGKQDTLESGVNIKSVNGQSILGAGNLFIPTNFSPVDEVIWREPKDFGEKINGVVGSNVKVYRDISDEILVLLGSGNAFGSEQYNDPYLKECVCGNGNTSVKEIYIQDGITSIGANSFNRFYSASDEYGMDRYWNVRNPSDRWSGIGVKTTSIVLPASITSIGKRAFQYCRISDTMIINSTGPLTIGQDAFQASSLTTMYIPNATSISGYNSNSFLIAALVNFRIFCPIESSISFSASSFLSVESIINIANHLATVEDGGASKTITLHAAIKNLCNNTYGLIEDGVYVKGPNGTISLTDFITNTKGWSLS